MTLTTDRNDLAPAADLLRLELEVHRDLVERELDVLGSAPDGSERVAALIREHEPLLPDGTVQLLIERLVARVAGLGPLQPLLEDELVTDILVNGDGSVWVERCGHVERTPVDVDEPTILHLIERIVGPLGLRADRASPLVDARLPDGSRVNAVVRPLAIDGPCLTIRRFAVRPHPLGAFCAGGVRHLLEWAITSRRNVLVSGGTGSGKTTLLNALAARIPSGERIITIEDAAELRLPGEHVVRLEARPANSEGIGEVRIRDLVRNALRMRPDRILIGEVRSGEALDLLQAMNTGHEGSLSTCHANSTADALRRLETMVLMSDLDLPLPAIREQIASSLDLIVQVARRPDGGRRVVAVGEVDEELDKVGRLRVRPLVSNDGLADLPERPARLLGVAPPDPSWVQR
ncbi:MAG: CpaF family protein [Actinobacteria bacterium]|nr:CpaF family protein [Actinomycetota bacterium]